MRIYVDKIFYLSTFFFFLVYFIFYLINRNVHVSFLIGIKEYSLSFLQIAFLQFFFNVLIILIITFFNQTDNFLSKKLLVWERFICIIAMLINALVLLFEDQTKYFWIGLTSLFCIFFLSIIIVSAFVKWLYNNIELN